MRWAWILFLVLSKVAMGWTLLSMSLRGWETNHLVVGVNYDNCSVSNAVLDDAIDQSFALWNEVTTANIVLSRGTSSTSVVEFTGQLATDAPVILCDPNLTATLGASADNIPGLARVYDAHPITYAGIILNAESGMAANIANISDESLVLTIAHETGHLLGLGHTDDPNALMFYNITGKSEAFLSQDDRDGLSFLYSRSEFSDAPFGCSSVHQRWPEVSQITLWALLVMFLLGLNLVVGRRLVKF